MCGFESQVMDLGRLGLSPFLPLLCSVCVRCQVRADGTGNVDVRSWSVTPALPHTSDHRVLPARPWPSDGGVVAGGGLSVARHCYTSSNNVSLSKDCES